MKNNDIFLTWSFWWLSSLLMFSISTITNYYFDYFSFFQYVSGFVILVLITIFFTHSILNFFAELSCDKKYTVIKKGHKRPLFTYPFCLPKILKVKELSLKKRFKFNDSFLSSTSHIHKLFGFTVGLSLTPHKNSFRFGWRTVGYRLELVVYYYVNGNVHNETIVYNLNFNNTYELTITKKTNLVILESKVVETGYLSKIYVNTRSNSIFGWKLGLYFEGENNIGAEQDIRIESV